MIEVYSGLYVNEATDAKNQDQLDETSEKVSIYSLSVSISHTFTKNLRHKSIKCKY